MNKKEHPGFVVAAGTSIMLMMGVAYVWGVYTEPLMDAFGWTRAQVSLPFSVFLIVLHSWDDFRRPAAGYLWAAKDMYNRSFPF